MEYCILGPLEVAHAGRLVQVGGPRHRKLLAVLLVHADEVVSQDSLVDFLWGESPPPGATAMLQVRISELRRALRSVRPDQPAPIVTRSSGYSLQLGEDQLDARRFQDCVSLGRHALLEGDAASAAATLHEACSLWRGGPLQDLADEAFAEAAVAKLERLHLQALEDLYDAQLRLGDCADALVELEALVAQHPLRERFWRQLIEAQYRSGQQGEALSTYERVREALAEGLGVDPGPELQELQAAILRQDPALAPLRTPPAAPVRTNLPGQLSTLVGRAAELAEVCDLVRRHRLVTVIGVGGAGKTRLALEVGSASVPHFPDGVWFVELASLTQPGLVMHTVADALGVREHPELPLADVLAEFLQNARLLIILDNCEHVIDEVAEAVHGLVGACPGISVLATSRERISVPGEHLRPLPGLSLPVTDDPDEVATADASRLLVERAAAVRPEFRLDAGTATAIARICHQLDGLPLAIELAAARVTALELGQIAERLDDRFRLLTGGMRTALPRHQTLRAVIDWSYELLEPADQLLFDAVSVFVGGFTLEAAEAVGADAADAESDVVSRLGRLVDRSLVLSETSPDGRRYRLLETLRVYGLDRLAERGTLDQLRQRHSEYFASVAKPAAIALRGRAQPVWLRSLELDHDNFRAALAWSLDAGADETAAKLAGSLYPFWDLHGHYSEGRAWLARVLGPGRTISPSVRGRALMGAALLAAIQGDSEASESACRDAALLGEQHSDPALLAHALQYLGFGAIVAGSPDDAREVLSESLRHARIAQDHWLESWALLFSGAVEMATGNFPEAADLLRETQQVALEETDPELVAWVFLLNGMTQVLSGSPAGGVEDLSASLNAFADLGGLWGLSVGMLGGAIIMATEGHLHDAAALLGASEKLRAAVGAGLVPFLGAHLETTVAQIRQVLGDSTFDVAWAAGQALSLTDALDLAAAAVAQALPPLAGLHPVSA